MPSILRWLLALCFILPLCAEATVNLTFSNSTAKLTNLLDATGTVGSGLTWGIVIDTAGDGFDALNGTHYFAPDAGMPLPGTGTFLRDHTWAITDDYFYRATSSTQVLTGTDGGAGGITSLTSLPYGPGVEAGDSFAVIWFSTPNSAAAGDKYGLFWIPQFILPSDGSGANYAPNFPGPDPARPASNVLAGLLGQYQDIAVEQPAGTGLAQGAARNFGSVAVGSHSSLTFTIKNTGLTLLSGFPISIDGGNAGDFSLTATPLSPLSPGGSTTFTVKFAPTAGGVRSAALHIGNDDMDENPFHITLEGTATAPEIVVEQPAGFPLADGLGSVGMAVPWNQVKTFAIRNTGTGSLTGLALSLHGTEAGNFTLGTLGTTTLAPGGSTTFTVTAVTPQTLPVGYRVATLRIASNDTDENPFDVTLTLSSIVRMNWRAKWFGNINQFGDGADNNDPDRDGVNNVLEFATGSNPTAATPAPGTLVDAGAVVEFTYTRARVALGECTFAVQWNDAISSAGWSSAGVTEVVLSDDGVVQVVKATVPRGSGARRFARLHITADPDEVDGGGSGPLD